MPFRRRFSQGLRSPAMVNRGSNIASAQAANLVRQTQVVQCIGGTSNGVASTNIPTIVKAVYIDVEVFPDAAPASPSRAIIWLYKNVSGATAIAIGDMTTPGNFLQRNGIIYMTQGSPFGASAPLMFRGWIRIPPRFQTFNEGDTLELVSTNTVGTWTACEAWVYKWRS